jgi:RNA polymerase sigma-70 factor (ECF subfamily)
MILLDKKFRRELEHQLTARFPDIAPSGFAEIAVGEACSDYYLAIDNGEVIHSSKGWIYNAAKNKILNELERLGHHYRIDQKTEHEIELPSENNFEEVENARLMLEELLPLIGEEKREALLLHKYAGYTLDETAEKLGIAVSTVEWRIRQAISELRKAMKKSK